MSKLKRLREMQNLTQVELGEILGTSKTNISHWESGENVPRGKFIRKMQEYFGVGTITRDDFKEEYEKKRELVDV